MKAQRKVSHSHQHCSWLLIFYSQICGAVKSGVKVFEHSQTTLLTGCTTHPGDQKYCSDHKSEQHPAVSSSKLTKENREQLEAVKEKEKHFKEQDFRDNVYIIEG